MIDKNYHSLNYTFFSNFRQFLKEKLPIAILTTNYYFIQSLVYNNDICEHHYKNIGMFLLLKTIIRHVH